MHRPDFIAAIGLALGAILGLLGTVVTQPHIQQICWAIDAAGLVMATRRKRRDATSGTCRFCDRAWLVKVLYPASRAMLLSVVGVAAT
jgi:hypothetical protein